MNAAQRTHLRLVRSQKQHRKCTAIMANSYTTLLKVHTAMMIAMRDHLLQGRSISPQEVVSWMENSSQSAKEFGEALEILRAEEGEE